MELPDDACDDREAIEAAGCLFGLTGTLFFGFTLSFIVDPDTTFFGESVTPPILAIRSALYASAGGA